MTAKEWKPIELPKEDEELERLGYDLWLAHASGQDDKARLVAAEIAEHQRRQAR